MPKSPVINRTVACGACGIVGLALLAVNAHGQSDSAYDPGWTKNFRLGALTGLGIKGQIKLRGSLAVNGNNPGPTGVNGANHNFDDGYVRVDDTGNAGGRTAYWGYDNASQYDAGSQTVSMHSANSVEATGSHDLDNKFNVGVELAYGQTLKQWDRTRLGWEFGFGYLPITLQDGGSSPISALVSRSTYTFSTAPIIMPDAPYHGGSSGIGPTIGDVATAGGTNSLGGNISNLGTLEADLFTFRLGPTLFYDISSRFGISGSIGPAFGFISETCNYNELIRLTDGTTSHLRGHFGTTDFVYGGYINVVGTVHVEQNGDVYLGVQYMPMSSSTFSKGGRAASVDLSGQVYISLGVNWIF